jgi:hypothetical protein
VDADFRHGLSKPAKMVVNGWALSTIVTMATGQPVTPYVSGYPSGLDGGVTGGVAYAGATSGRAGWLPRNAYTAPGFHDVDFRLARQFPIGERVKLALVGDAFNLFNHTNVVSVNTTAFNYTGGWRDQRFVQLRGPYQRVLFSERGIHGSHGHQQPAGWSAAVAGVGAADLLTAEAYSKAIQRRRKDSRFPGALGGGQAILPAPGRASDVAAR